MKNRLLLKVIIAIALAVCAGLLTGTEKELLGVPFIEIYGLIGQLFLNALTLVVVPLVASSIITGTARLGNDKSFGDVGFKTFFYFILTSILAVFVGLICVNIINPGQAQDYSALISISQNESTLKSISQHTVEGTFGKIAQVALEIIPSNILAVASQGKLLGLIFFSILFGFFSTRIQQEQGKIICGFWEAVFQIMMEFTHLVMKALPIGVFGLVAKVIATSGVATLKPLLLFVLTVLIGFGIFSFIVIPFLLLLVARVKPLDFYRAVFPALVTAFSTSSTAATLPVTIECLEQRVGISNRITSFTLPLGASVNMSASALYACVVVIFIAQAYGLAIDIPTQFVIGLMALLMSMGMAGVPSAGLISIMAILQTIGLPAEAIGLILAAERFLDMLRTVVNVLTNSCSTVLVASSMNERIKLSTNN